MNVNYTASAQQWAEGYALIQQATRRLEEILGASAELVSAEWARTADDKGRILYRLTLKDYSGQVSTVFSPDELMNPMHMHVRLYRLWGDLLQRRSDEQHKVVQAISGQISGGQEGG